MDSVDIRKYIQGINTTMCEVWCNNCYDTQKYCNESYYHMYKTCVGFVLEDVSYDINTIYTLQLWREKSMICGQGIEFTRNIMYMCSIYTIRYILLCYIVYVMLCGDQTCEMYHSVLCFQ